MTFKKIQPEEKILESVLPVSKPKTPEPPKSPKETVKKPSAQTIIKPTVSSLSIKPFFFPYGKPNTAENEDSERILKSVHKLFESLDGGKLNKSQAASLAKVSRVMYYY